MTMQAELILVLLNREDAYDTKKEGRRKTVVHGQPDARCPYRFYQQLIGLDIITVFPKIYRHSP